jgi:hypothetical protein
MLNIVTRLLAGQLRNFNLGARHFPLPKVLRLTLGLTHLPSLWAQGLKQPGLTADQFPINHGMLRTAVLFALIF